MYPLSSDVGIDKLAQGAQQMRFFDHPPTLIDKRSPFGHLYLHTQSIPTYHGPRNSWFNGFM